MKPAASARSAAPATRRCCLAMMLAAALLAGRATSAPAAVQRSAEQATIMVKLYNDSAAATRAFARRHRLAVVRRFTQIGWVELRAGRRVASLLRSLRSERNVLATDAVMAGEHFGPQFTPRDNLFTTSLTYTDGTPVAWHYTKVNLPAAWDVTRGGASTSVAVIDSEFDSTNPDLQPKLKTGYNVKSGTVEYHTSNVRATDADVALDPTNCSGHHGSHVAGIVAAATDNNKGVSGAGFDITVLPIRSSFNFTTGAGATDAQFVADVTEGLIFAADKGVAAINMSFGTTRPHDPMRDALNFASSKGVTLVASAGNDQRIDPGVLKYPAAYPNVIAVAATKPNDDIATFSTNGDFVDIAAPGDPVLSTWDGRCGNAFVFTGDDVPFAVLSGTSMSSPIVAGIVGLMKSVRPDLTPAEVEQILTSTTRDLGAGGKDPVFGHGLVDASKAVIAARDFQRPVPPPPPPPPAPAPPPAPPPPPPVIAAPPPLVVKVLGLVTYNRAKGRLAARIECGVVCIGSARAATRGRRLGSATFSLKAGGRKTLLVKVSKRTLRRLARGRKIGIRLTITANGVDGRSRTIAPTISVRP